MGLDISADNVTTAAGETKTYLRLGEPFKKNAPLFVHCYLYKDKASRDSGVCEWVEPLVIPWDDWKEIYDAIAEKAYALIKAQKYPKATDVIDDTITLDQSSLSVSVGATGTLNATVTPTGSTVTWTSSDETVATVKEGVVTGVKAGAAMITATNGTASAMCAVTVTEAAA